MKKSILCLPVFFLLSLQMMQAQKSYGSLYHPEANAATDIEAALKKAAAEGKFVILQGGGNWCSWCYKFHDFIEKDEELKAFVDENFVWYHLNYSKENTNKTIFEQYGFPQRFGFPVLIVLDEKGNRLHTQDSALLESGDGYDRKKVLNTLKAWSPKALDPEGYQGK